MSTSGCRCAPLLNAVLLLLWSTALVIYKQLLQRVWCLQEVSMKVVTRGDECRIKLYDMKTGECACCGIFASARQSQLMSYSLGSAGAFFAECPVPHPDVAPLQTVEICMFLLT